MEGIQASGRKGCRTRNRAQSGRPRESLISSEVVGDRKAKAKMSSESALRPERKEAKVQTFSTGVGRTGKKRKQEGGSGQRDRMGRNSFLPEAYERARPE